MQFDQQITSITNTYINGYLQVGFARVLIPDTNS